jgi:hypothetical protein
MLAMTQKKERLTRYARNDAEKGEGSVAALEMTGEGKGDFRIALPYGS